MPLMNGPDFSPILMRLAQIFGQPNSGQSQVNTEAAGIPPDALTNLMNYQPERTANDMFNKHIGAMPTREEYKPSGLRQIGSVLAGLGQGVSAQGIAGGNPIGFQGNPNAAMATSENYRSLPFNRALNDWENKVKPLELAANNERGYNLGNRQLLLGEASRMIQQQRADSYGREQESKDEKRGADIQRDKDKVEISRNRANAYIFEKEHPDWKAVPGTVGTVKYINPKTKEIFDTGLDSKTNLTDEEKINLQNKGRLSEIGARTEGAIKVEGVKQPNRIELAQTPRPARITYSAGKDESPAAAARRLINTANQVKLDHPEWNDYIKISGLGISVEPPSGDSWFSSGLDASTYNKIVTELKKGAAPVATPTTNITPNSSTNTSTPNVTPTIMQTPIKPAGLPAPEKGYVYVAGPDGKIISSIPESNVPRLDKSKYQVVK